MYTPLNLLEVGKSYQQTFLVENVTPKKVRTGAKAGSPYLLIMVRDVTGRMKTFVWDTSIRDTQIKPGQYVHMNVEVREHQGDKTLVTHQISVVKRPEDLEPYVRGESDHVLDIYADDIAALTDQIDDPDYLRIIKHAQDNLNYLEDLRGCAFGTRGPLSHVGGLLVHTVRVAYMAVQLMEAAEKVDAQFSRGLVIAACMLRNWGYTQVLELDGDAWQVNDYGKQMGLRWASTQVARDCMIDTVSSTNTQIPFPKQLAITMITNATDEKEVAILEGKIVLAAERLVNTLHYSVRNQKLYRGHLDV